MLQCSGQGITTWSGTTMTKMMREDAHVACDHLKDMNDQRRRHRLNEMAGRHEDVGAALQRRG